jgi:hypothetical protein
MISNSRVSRLFKRPIPATWRHVAGVFPNVSGLPEFSYAAVDPDQSGAEAALLLRSVSG